MNKNRLTALAISAVLLGAVAPVMAGTTVSVATTLDVVNIEAGKNGFTGGVQGSPPFSPAFDIQLSAGDTFDFTIGFLPGQQLTINNLEMIWAFSYADQQTDVNGTGSLSLLDSAGNALYTTNMKTDTEGSVHFGQYFYNSDFPSLPASVTFNGLHYVGTVNSYLDPAVTVRNYSSPAFYYTAASVPEPETYALMFVGLGLVGFIARRRQT